MSWLNCSSYVLRRGRVVTGVGCGLECISSGGNVDHGALSAGAPPPGFPLGGRTLFHTQTTKTRVYSLSR